MAEVSSEERVAAIEEAEKRGLLPAEQAAAVRQARKKGLIKTTRDKRLVKMEDRFLSTDAKDMPDEDARAMTNALRRLRDGDTDDLDGKKKYGRSLTGQAYMKEYQAELDPKTYQTAFPNKLDEYKALDSDEAKLKVAQDIVKDEDRKKAGLLDIEETGGTLGTGTLETTRFDVPLLADKQKQKMIELGEAEAWRQSYVPVRQWLENKIGRDVFVQETAREAARTGVINPGAWNQFSPEDRAVVSSYVNHTRPFDVSEGVLGTLNQASRAALSSLWNIGKAPLKATAEIGVFETSVGLWGLVDPVGAGEFALDVDRLRKSERARDFALSLKAPDRNWLGKGVVGASESVPFMLAIIYGGPLGTFAAGSSAGLEFRDQLIDDGVSVERAQIAGAAAGLTAVYVERLGGLGGKTKLGAKLSKAMIAKSAGESLMKRLYDPRTMARFAEMWGRNGLAEFSEEWIEGTAQDIIGSVAKGQDVDVIEALQEGARQAKEASGSVAVMTFFGSARSALSSNESEVLRSNKTLNRIGEMAFENLKADKNATVEGLEQVNDAIIDTWVNNPKSEARTLLREMGISAEALKKAEPTLNRLAELQKDHNKEVKLTEKEVSAEEARFEDIRIAMEESGVDSKLVDQITGSLDPKHVGRYGQGIIEVLDGIKDTSRVFNHEAFHFLVESGAISEEDWAILVESTKKDEYAKLNLRYDAYTGDAKVEEVMADAWGEFSPQERGVWQKVKDFARDMFNMSQTEKDVFRRLDSHMQKIAKSGKAKGLTGELRKANSEGGVTLKRQDAQFAIRDEGAIQSLQDAAESYALAKIDGRDANTLANTLSARTGRPSEDIIARGEQLVAESNARLEDSATRLEKRIDIRTSIQRKALVSELRKARKEGGSISKTGAKGEKGIETAKSKEQKREARQKHPIEFEMSQAAMLGVVLTNDAKKLMDTISEEVDKVVAEKSIKQKSVKDSIYKRSLAHNLWQMVRKLPYERFRNRIQTELTKMRDDKTNVDTANKIATDIVDRLNRIDELSKSKQLVKKLGNLFKSDIGRKPGTQTLKVDRTINADDHAEFALIGQVWSKTQAKVDAVLVLVDKALSGNDAMAFDPDKTEGILRTVSEFMPAINSPAFDSLGPLQKVQYAQVVLKSWGAIKSASSVELAQAIEELEQSLKTAKNVQLEAMRKQSVDAKLGVGWLRLGTANKSGKKALIQLSPTFQGIRQRIEEIGNFASERGKDALESLMNKLDFQGANTKFDALQLEWGKRVGELLSDSYNSVFLDSAVRKLNAKRSEWGKFHPRGEAMSKSQLMQILVTWRQDSYKGNLRQSGINQEVINEIEKVMTDGDMLFLDGLVQLYSDIGTKLNEVSQEIWGEDIANNDPFYMPVTVDFTSEWNGREVRVSPLAPPTFNKRVSHTVEMDLDAGITQMLDSRMAQSAHFIAYAKSHVLANSVFTDKESAKNIERTYGKEIWGGLKNHLTDIYSNGGSDSFKSKGLQKILNALTLRALSGNLKLPFTQTTSIPSYALRYGSLNLLRMVGRSISNPSAYGAAVVDIARSAEFKSRLQLGGTEFMQQALKERFGVSSFDMIPNERVRDVGKFTADLIKKMYRYGMITNKGGDIVPILLVGPSIYMEEMNKSGATPKAAMNKTWEVIQQTQQSYAVKDRSALSRRGGILGKLLSAFTTTPGQYLAFESAAFRSMTAKVQQVDYNFVEAIKSKEFRKLADTVFINHAVLPGMFFTMSKIISNFMRGDDWDEDDTNGLLIAMATGPFSAWAIFYGLTKDFLNEAMGGRANVWGGLLPVDSFRKDARLFGQIVEHGMNGDFDEALETAWKEFQNMVTPARQISDTIKNR